MSNDNYVGRKPLLAISLICFGSIGFALYSQHVWNMQPCPWCIVQRMMYLLIGTACFFVSFSSAGLRAGTLGGTAMASIAGIAIVTYQQLVASKQLSCTFSAAEKFVMWTGLDELVPAVFQVTASCADAAFSKLMGIPYEIASAGVFVLILGIALFSLVKRNR